uniref:Putative 56 kDa salivary secreted protein n=1 Tax=Culex tarsalis TaxID=7177 RepID=A0A1Q3F4R4_CULTA
MKTAVILLVLFSSFGNIGSKRGITQHAKLLSVSKGVTNCKCNIAANADNILQNLESLRTSVQELEKVESLEYSHTAECLRAPIKDVVDVGSTIFISLKKISQSSSDNVEVLARNVQVSIQQVKLTENEHVEKLQQVRGTLGDTNFKIVENIHSEFMEKLDEISIENNNLVSSNRVSNNKAMLNINQILKNYGTKLEESIPGLEPVLNSVVSADRSITRIRNAFSKQRLSLRSNLLRVRPYIESNVITNMQRNFKEVDNKITDKGETVVAQLNQFYEKISCECVKNTISIVQSISESVTDNVKLFVKQADKLVVRENYTQALMNESEELVVKLSKNLYETIIQGDMSESCLAKYQNELEKNSETVYSQSTECVWETVYDLKEAALNLNCAFRLALIDLKHEFKSVEKCVTLPTKDTSEMALFQAVECLEQAKLYLMQRRVYVEQMNAYQKMFRKEVSYSSSRYEFCLNSTSAQVGAQVKYLSDAITECGNVQS